MPNLDLMVREANVLLERANLPRCTFLEPVGDGDTINPIVIGHSFPRRYVIKVAFGHPQRGTPVSLAEQHHTANWFRENRNLPIPEHLCHASPQDPLPLMVMEWMPGDQLRLALPRLSSEGGKRVAQDWGHNLARLHSTQVPDGMITSTLETATGEWGDRERFQKVLQSIDGLRSSRKWLRRLRDEIQRFLQDRLDAFNDAPLGIMKRDSDIRDFLVVSQPEAYISAMLDWECVYYGYVLYDCLLAYMKLTAFRRNELWPYFCESYESEMGSPIIQGPAVEYCLMCRCLVEDNPSFDEIIVSLVEGRKIPFEQRG